jgi:hypothetical protein
MRWAVLKEILKLAPETIWFAGAWLFYRWFGFQVFIAVTAMLALAELIMIRFELKDRDGSKIPK